MPVDYRAPNINARSLGQHLRQIREILELSYEDAAAHLGVNADWLARVETGFGTITPEQVGEILDAYGTPPHIRDVLVDLATRPAGPPWLARHVGRLKALVRDIYTVESESSLVHVFGIGQLPELVRCEAYARLVFEHHIPEVDVDEEWDLLSSRQRHRPGGAARTLDVVLDGLTLRHHGGPPEVFGAQLDHLLDLGGASTVRVIPPETGVHAGLDGPFDVLEFSGMPDRVSLVHTVLGIDIAAGDLWDTWQKVESVALSPADSAAFLADLRATL
ncbi:helix-turn-helix domain-containing protein [Actinomadura sp. NAK00032]|uniref:helix-turn-helix domain-containing protein n=1 Tax=Actinomadura sp. NAK00032 TaxID=2742128 RepID=UPI001591D31D|nr:helix-turn-helix transcriptional regulator [Actinomadura sp. NAK00032]QKW34346.1 helix-turn-helix domain-containing protein [Actinomadura sp. NAK00032]